MSQPTARPRDAEATRAAILDAAEALFAEHGFGACALSEVAAAAGVTKSLIHHHFGSKERLWEQVLERRFAEYAAVQDAILARDERDLAGLERSVDALFDFLERNPAFVRLHAWADAGDGKGFRIGSELTERGVRRLRELQHEGVVRADVEPAAVLAAYFGLVEHWFHAQATLRGRFGSDLPTSESYRRAAVRILTQGVRA